MFDNLYNVLILTLFFFSLKKINDNFFKLSKNFYFTVFLYHLVITAFYITIFKNGAADYKTYLNLSTFQGFFKQALVSSDLVVAGIAFLKLILHFNDLTLIIFFSSLSFFGIIFFYKNLINLGLKKQSAQLLIFIPSIHFWTCVPGKDSLIFFFLAWFFYLYMNKKLYFSILVIFFVFLLRPHVGIIFLSSIFIVEFFLIKGHKKVMFLLVFLTSIYLALTTPSVGSFLISTDTLSSNPIINIFHRISRFMSQFGESVTSYENSNFILNIFSYIFLPVEYFFKKNSLLVNASMLIVVVESIFIFHLISLHQNKYNIKIDKRIIYFLLICCCFYLLTMPQFLFNFGLNTRQKWMIMPFLIYLIFILKDRLVKIKNR